MQKEDIAAARRQATAARLNKLIRQRAEARRKQREAAEAAAATPQTPATAQTTETEPAQNTTATETQTPPPARAGVYEVNGVAFRGTEDGKGVVPVISVKEYNRDIDPEAKYPQADIDFAVEQEFPAAVAFLTGSITAKEALERAGFYKDLDTMTDEQAQAKAMKQLGGYKPYVEAYLAGQNQTAGSSAQNTPATGENAPVTPQDTPAPTGEEPAPTPTGEESAPAPNLHQPAPAPTGEESAPAPTQDEPAQREYRLNDTVPLQLPDGTTVQATVQQEEDSDGRIEVATDMPVNGRRVNWFTRQELDAMAPKPKPGDNGAGGAAATDQTAPAPMPETPSSQQETGSIPTDGTAPAPDARMEKKRKQRKRMDKHLNEMRQAKEKGDDFAVINALNSIEHNHTVGGAELDVLTPEEKAEIQAETARMKAAGYTWDTVKRGDRYDEGMKVIADFTTNDNLAPGEKRIKQVKKPTIIKDGKMVQAAEIVVEQSPYDSEEEAAPTQNEADGKGTDYTLSDVLSDNGEHFYQDGNGNIDLVSIPQEVFDHIGRKAAPFRLIPSMLKHVFDRHGKELQLSSPQEAIKFVLDVMGTFDHVRLGEGGALIFSVENGRHSTGKRAVTVLLPSANGDYYGIKSSGYERIDGLTKRELLWEKGANVTSPTDVASANVPTANASQGNGQSGSASNIDNSSTGKGSETSTHEQEQEESTPHTPEEEKDVSYTPQFLADAYMRGDMDAVASIERAMAKMITEAETGMLLRTYHTYADQAKKLKDNEPWYRAYMFTVKACEAELLLGRDMPGSALRGIKERAKLARQTHDPRVLDMLSYDKSPEVVLAVIANEHTPVELLQAFWHMEAGERIGGGEIPGAAWKALVKRRVAQKRAGWQGQSSAKAHETGLAERAEAAYNRLMELFHSDNSGIPTTENEVEMFNLIRRMESEGLMQALTDDKLEQVYDIDMRTEALLREEDLWETVNKQAQENAQAPTDNAQAHTPVEQKPGESVFDVAERVAREAQAKKKTPKPSPKKPAPKQEKGKETPTQRALAEALVEMLRDAGIEVVTDQAEMRKALNEGNAQLLAALESLKKAAMFIRRAFHGGRTQDRYTLDLPQSTQTMIRRVMGRDFDSQNIRISTVRNRQNNQGTDGMKPLTEKDTELVPYIMLAPDYVRKGTDEYGRESIRFYKTLSNGYVVVVEKEQKNSPNDMDTISIWAESTSNVADVRSPYSNSGNNPGATSTPANIAQREAAQRETNAVTVTISTDDAAKIRNDAQTAIAEDIISQQMTVYHGSPHLFQAFDHSHMGSGEGRQVHGWGTYVAANPKTSEHYAMIGAATGEKTGNHFYTVEIPDDNGQNYLDEQKEYTPQELEHIIARLRSVADNGEDKKSTPKGWASNIVARLRQLTKTGRNPRSEPAGDYTFRFSARNFDYVPVISVDEYLKNINPNLPASSREQSDVDKLVEKDFIHALRLFNGSNYLDTFYYFSIPEHEWVNLPYNEKRAWAERLLAGYKPYVQAYMNRNHSLTERGYLDVVEEELRGRTVSGYSLYQRLSSSNKFAPWNSSKRASGLLHRAGFTGITYEGERDGRCYVIFNENDLRITSHTQFLRTPGGEVYGFVQGGKVYLDPALLNTEAPVHEYTHLWDTALRRANPALWERGKELMKQLPLWEEVKNDPAYADIAHNEDLLASEVHARLSGKDGADLLRKMVEQAQKGGPFEAAEKAALAERIRRWLKEALNWVRNAFTGQWNDKELAGLTIEEFAAMPVRDLAYGVNPDFMADYATSRLEVDDLLEETDKGKTAESSAPAKEQEQQDTPQATSSATAQENGGDTAGTPAAAPERMAPGRLLEAYQSGNKQAIEETERKMAEWIHWTFANWDEYSASEPIFKRENKHLVAWRTWRDMAERLELSDANSRKVAEYLAGLMKSELLAMGVPEAFFKLTKTGIIPAGAIAKAIKKGATGATFDIIANEKRNDFKVLEAMAEAAPREDLERAAEDDRHPLNVTAKAELATRDFVENATDGELVKETKRRNSVFKERAAAELERRKAEREKEKEKEKEEEEEKEEREKEKEKEKEEKEETADELRTSYLNLFWEMVGTMVAFARNDFVDEDKLRSIARRAIAAISKWGQDPNPEWKRRYAKYDKWAKDHPGELQALEEEVLRKYPYHTPRIRIDPQEVFSVEAIARELAKDEDIRAAFQAGNTPDMLNTILRNPVDSYITNTASKYGGYNYNAMEIYEASNIIKDRIKEGTMLDDIRKAIARIYSEQEDGQAAPNPQSPAQTSPSAQENTPGTAGTPAADASSRQAGSVPTDKAAPAKESKAKIEDYGEEIAGARKNAMKELADTLEDISIADLIANPVGKVFKRKDYAKMVANGQLSREDAIVLETLTRLIMSRSKPFATRRTSKVELWAKGVKEMMDAMKAYAQATEEERAKVLAGMKEGYNTMSALVHVLEELGYPEAKIGKFKIHEAAHRGPERYLMGDRYYPTPEAAMAAAVKSAQIDLGYDDVAYTPGDFSAAPHSTYEYVPVDRWSVEWGSTLLNGGIMTFATEEEAKKYMQAPSVAKRKNLRMEKIEAKTRTVTGMYYTLQLHHPATGERYEIMPDEKFSSKEEALDYINNEIEALGQAANKLMQEVHGKGTKTTLADRLKFFVDYDRESRKYEVLLGLDKHMMVGLVKGLDYKEARKWIEENRDRVAEKVREMTAKMREGKRFETDRERKGKDYRKGRDISAEEFAGTFGFRGVQFGNWTNQEDRQRALNGAYDAFMDLAGVLGLSPRALSLAGELGIAFGARGSGSAAAHYEPAQVVINLTKTHGAGSLAHEWWHALDHYFSRQGGKPSRFLTEEDNGYNANLREAMRKAYHDLSQAVKNSAYHKRNQDSEYWGSLREETARLFAEWVKGKAQQKGEYNDFLAHPIAGDKEYRQKMYNSMKSLADTGSFEEFAKKPESLWKYRYPSESELQELSPAVQHIFDTVQEREEDGKTILFHRGKAAASQPGTVQHRIAEAVIQLLGDAGITVVTDTVKMQRVMEDTSLDKEMLEELEGNKKSSHRYESHTQRMATAMRGRIPDAKVEINNGNRASFRLRLTDLLDSLTKHEMSVPDFLDAIRRAFSVASPTKKSGYVSQTLDGEKHVLRISDHPSTAYNFAQSGQLRNNTSVVIRLGSGSFRPDGRVTLVEYYYDPASLTNVKMQGIVKGLQDWLAGGEYTDTAYDSRKVSPQPRHSGNAQMLRTPQGEVYGFVKDGKVYLDPKLLNPNTPIHEYTHLWDVLLQRSNPALWERGKELMKQTPLWDEVVNDPDYADISADEDLVASEVHARLAGSEGQALLDRMVEDAQHDDALATAGKVALAERIRRWLKDVLQQVRSAFTNKWNAKGLAGLTIEEFARMPIRDLAFGVNPGMVKTEEEAQEAPDTNLRFRLGDPAGTFAERQAAAVENRGTVMPGLNEASVEVVDVPKHGYKGTAVQAKEQAVTDAVERYTEIVTDENGKEKRVPKIQHYDNFGQEFDYTISSGSIDESMNRKSLSKSANFGAHIAVLNHLPEVITNSIEVEEHPDYMKDENGKRTTGKVNSNALIHIFYGAIDIDGEMYRVKTTLKEFSDAKMGNTQYTYQVTNVELLTEGSASSSNGVGSVRSEEIVCPVAKLLDGVEKSYDSGKKLLDESASSDTRQREGDGPYTDAEVSYENDPRAKFVGRPVRTKKQQAEFAARERRRMLDTARELAKKLGIAGQVEIRQDATGLTGRMASAKGWFDPKTGKIVVIASNHASAEDIAATILHEGVAHYGLRKLFGPHFDTFLDNVYRNAEEGIRRKIAAMAARNGWDFRTATEEYLASLAEDTNFEHVGYSWWSKIKRFFIDMLHDLGLPGFEGSETLTDNELRYILWRSYRNLTTDGGRNGLFGVAEDIAMQHRLQVGNYAPQTDSGGRVAESRGSENANGKGKKNTPLTGNPAQSHDKETSGSSNQSPMGTPKSTFHSKTGVAAKLLNHTVSAKNNIKKFFNGDKSIALDSLNSVLRGISRLLGLQYKGRSNYAEFATPKGTVTFRLSDHNAWGDNFKKNGSDMNISVVIERNHYDVPPSEIPFEEYVCPMEVFEQHKEQAVRSIMNGVKSLIETGEFVDESGLFTKSDESDSSGLLFRSTIEEPEDGVARDYYERRVREPNRGGSVKRGENLMWRLHKEYIDSMSALQAFTDGVLKETGGALSSGEDAYKAENAMSSKNKAQTEVYDRDFFAPLLDAVDGLADRIL